MKKLIIVCEDTFGLDVKRIAEAICADRVKKGLGSDFEIAGCICPESVREGLKLPSLDCLGSIEDWVPGRDEIFAMGVYVPDRKQTFAETLKRRGAEFATLRAPWVHAPASLEIGEGSVVSSVVIKENAKIGRFVTMFYSLAGAVQIDDYSSVMAMANVTTARIASRVYVGPGAVILEDIPIGNDARVCANSVVVKAVRENTKVSGNPARRVRNMEVSH